MVSRNYVFTFYPREADGLSVDEVAFYYAANLEELFSDPLFRYVVVNIEVCPTTDRVHWQGYMELNRPAGFVAIKDRVPLLSDAEFGERRGTQCEAITYCQKVETRHPDATGFYEYGEKAPGQGHRSDLDSLSQMLVSGANQRAIAEAMPGMFVRYHTGISAYISVMAEDAVLPEEGFVPRPWQQDVIDLIQTEPDDRTVVWVTDPQGGRGKTRLAGHLISNYGAIQLSGAIAHMAHAYAETKNRVVVFDITRAAEERTNHLYTFAEMLKSGRIFSTKYRSRMVRFTPPHVLIFSNQSWDRSLFTADRVKEIQL